MHPALAFADLDLAEIRRLVGREYAYLMRYGYQSADTIAKWDVRRRRWLAKSIEALVEEENQAQQSSDDEGEE